MSTRFTPELIRLGLDGARVTFRTNPPHLHQRLRRIDRWIAYANSVVERVTRLAPGPGARVGSGVKEDPPYPRTRRGVSHMARKKLPADITDVQEIMGSICDKWALPILHQPSHGPKRHGELHRGIRGISRKDADLDAPKARAGSPGAVHGPIRPAARVDYALTRLGWSSTGPLHALYRWTEAHLKEIHRARCAAQPPPSSG